MWRASFVIRTLAATVALASTASAQAELQGHVYGAERQALANADVSVPELQRRTLTDSLGRFRLQGILPGTHLVITRSIGFRPDSVRIFFAVDEALVHDVMLKVAVAELPALAIRDTSRRTALARIADFEHRRTAGIGRFVTRDDLETSANRPLGEIIATRVPGIAVHHSGSGPEAWAASGRTTGTAKCELCRAPAATMMDPTDAMAGAPPACYLDVYVNGTMVYDSTRRMALFNLNSYRPSEVEGVEVYTGAGQIPVEYNKTGGTCGVMLVWTREPR